LTPSNPSSNLSTIHCISQGRLAWLTTPHSGPLANYLGLARTACIRCKYGVFGREITKYTVIYGYPFLPSPLLSFSYATSHFKIFCREGWPGLLLHTLVLLAKASDSLAHPEEALIYTLEAATLQPSLQLPHTSLMQPAHAQPAAAQQRPPEGDMLSGRHAQRTVP